MNRYLETPKLNVLNGKFALVNRSERSARTLACRVETRLDTFFLGNEIQKQASRKSRHGTHECVRYVSARMACEKPCLSEVLHQQDVASALVHLSVKNPATVARDAESRVAKWRLLVECS